MNIYAFYYYMCISTKYLINKLAGIQSLDVEFWQCNVAMYNLDVCRNPISSKFLTFVTKVS